MVVLWVFEDDSLLWANLSQVLTYFFTQHSSRSLLCVTQSFSGQTTGVGKSRLQVQYK